MTNLNLPALIPPPDPSDCGPAMRKLTEKQQIFVIAMVTTGGIPTKAAVVAGYSQKHDMHQVISSNMMRNEKILAAIREEADKRLRSGTLLGASVLVEIAQDTLHKDRFKAAAALLDRGGLMTVQKIEVAHTHELKRRDENEAYIVEQCKAQGIDPKKILGYDPSDIQDADFEEVAEEEIEW